MSGLDSVSSMKALGTADLIADQLRERIHDGSFAAGEPINEVHLAARLEMSRGPVREAVQRLVQEGLLTSVRNRGTSVVQLGPADIADIYQARLAIEREAARVVMAEPDADLIHTLEEILQEMDRGIKARSWSEVSRADLKFHQNIVHAVGSRRLNKMFSTLVAETLLCIYKFEGIYDHPGDIVDQHRRLFELLSSGDEAAYLREIDKHLKNSIKKLVDAQSD